MVRRSKKKSGVDKINQATDAEKDINGLPILLSKKQRTIFHPNNPGRIIWEAHPKMPDDMVLEVKRGAACGEPIYKSNGDLKGFCTATPKYPIGFKSPNHCDYHSSAEYIMKRTDERLSKLPPRDPRFGGLDDILTDEEKKIWLDTDINSLDFEIGLVKSMIIKATRKADIDDEFIESIFEEIKQSEDKGYSSVTKTFKKSSDQKITRLLNTLSRLYSQKINLENSQDPDDTDGTHLHVYLPGNERTHPDAFDSQVNEGDIPESDFDDDED